ncbi:selenium-dependent xanthine dehydrogenase [Bdellovibrionota bacterium FG-1]
MEFSLNGKKQGFVGDPELSLFSYLRKHAGLISPKDGCSGEGVCGACSVQVDGKPIFSCVPKMKTMAGKSIVTLEGIEPKRREAYAEAFTKAGGIQCGFCTPGIVAQADALLNRNADPTRQEVVNTVNRNICRCTGYHKVVDSVLLAAQLIRDGKSTSEISATLGQVGGRYPKYDSRLAVLGERPFVCDLKMPGMLYGVLKFSDHPRARILSIDTSVAVNVPGVTRVFTAKDIPGARKIGLIIPDWPLMVGEGEITGYIGDVLALVVASSEEIAREAASKLGVKYEVLTPLTDPFEAMKPESPKVHEQRPEYGKGRGNILSLSEVKRGDVEKVIQESAFVAQGRYTTQRIEHAFLEMECCVAEPISKNAENAEGVRVYSQGQGAYEDRKQIAKILGLAEKDVNVIQVQNGGAFGGKEDLTVQGHAALGAFLLKQPVRVALTRGESIRMHPKRHPFVMDYVLGCDRNGRLTVLKAEIVGDSGAYASVGMKVVERGVGHASGAYFVPNFQVSGTAVYTNNVPCGAMRGFGVNQTAFAMESCMDELCEKGGFDRWQFRFDNVIKKGDRTSTGQIIRDGAGLQETLLAVRDDFYKAKYAGLACGIKNTGIGNGMPDVGEVMIEFLAPSDPPNLAKPVRVVIHHGWTEMGQGVHTMAIQSLCEETGLDPSWMEVRVDTSYETVCGMTTSSRATSLVGNSIIQAAKALREDLKAHSVQELIGRRYPGKWICDWTTKPGTGAKEEITHYSYSYATQLVVLDEGGKIDTLFAAHDAGKIMNPTLFEGQIEGAIHMGLGYALTENLPMEGGFPLSLKLKDCGILKAKGLPKIVVRGVEVKDSVGPYGVKGVGEIGLVPTAAAVANAFYQFDKKRRYSLPLYNAEGELK